MHPTLRTLKLTVLSTILLVATLPFLDIGLLSFIALVPYFLILFNPATTKKDAALVSGCVGFLYIFAVVFPLGSIDGWWWLTPESFWWNYRELALWLGLAATSLIAGSLLFICFGLLVQKMYRKTPPLLRKQVVFVFNVALLWVVLEYVRSLLVFGFTWGHIGHSLHDTPFIAFATFGGVYGLSFLVVFINGCLAFALQQKRVVWVYICILFLVCVGVFYSSTALFKIEKEKSLRVAIVSPYISVEERLSVEGHIKTLSLLDKTFIQEENVDLVILPENIFSGFLINLTTLKPEGYEEEYFQKNARTFDRLIEISKEHPTTSFVFGVHTKRGADIHNSLVVLENASVEGLYHKEKLMPFGEYTPFPFSLNKKSQKPQNLPLYIKNTPVLPYICSEMLVNGQLNNRKPKFAIQISNEGIFKSPLVAKQNQIIAEVLGVKHNIPILRSVTGGISGFIGNHSGKSEDVFEEGQVLSATMSF